MLSHSRSWFEDFVNHDVVKEDLGIETHASAIVIVIVGETPVLKLKIRSTSGPIANRQSKGALFHTFDFYVVFE